MWMIRSIQPSIHFHPCVHLSVCLSFVVKWTTTDVLLFTAAAGLSWIVLETVCYHTGWVVGSGERRMEGGREGGVRESQTIPLNTDTGLSQTGLSEGLLTFLRFRAHTSSFTIQWLRWNNTSLLRFATNGTLLITVFCFVNNIPGDAPLWVHKAVARCNLFILNGLTSFEQLHMRKNKKTQTNTKRCSWEIESMFWCRLCVYSNTEAGA